MVKAVLLGQPRSLMSIYEFLKSVKEIFMKEKILNFGPIRAFSQTKLWQWAAHHPLLGKFCNYEVVTYIVCGVLTTIVSYASYFICRSFSASILVSQLVSWVLAVLFAYVVNKVFVFLSPDWSRQTVIKELIPFITCRISSLVAETIIMEVTVGLLHWNEPLMKILANVVVLVMNYVGSKLFVFRKNK